MLLHSITELETYTTLSYTLLYAGVQLERRRVNKDQDYGNYVIYSSYMM